MLIIDRGIPIAAPPIEAMFCKHLHNFLGEAFAPGFPQALQHPVGVLNAFNGLECSHTCRRVDSNVRIDLGVQIDRRSVGVQGEGLSTRNRTEVVGRSIVVSHRPAIVAVVSRDQPDLFDGEFEGEQVLKNQFHTFGTSIQHDEFTSVLLVIKAKVLYPNQPQAVQRHG